MPRNILDDARIHPDIQAVIGNLHQDIVQEVEQAIAKHPIVVVGMAQNPHVRRARALLADAGFVGHYLEYGSYFSGWRRRNALKLWTGWPTFPMVFVKGVLVGGAKDLQRLLARGELRRMLG